MKPTADNEARTITSTLEGEDVRMRIHEGATQHIMGILSNQLYEDPELAIVREYATNAIDAHIAAGVERQIEVETPSDLKPVLIVRDFGVGLDADEIREIYSAYGASTKRDTDDQTGMLGLGCKSAFAYCDQFTLVSVKAGVETTVSVSRDETGAGRMKILSEDDTEAGNGTVITIPAKSGNEIAEKAREFFRFWKPGTVLLDGEDPPALGGFQLTDDIHVTDGHGDVIVMGNVPYPTDLEVLAHGQRAVAYVEMGAVHFTPSREGLQDTKRTRDTIEAIQEAFNTAREAAMERELAAATTRVEALAAYLAVRDRLFVGRKKPDANYLGHPVPTSFRYAGRPELYEVPARAPYYRGGGSTKYNEIDAETAAAAIWVLGFDNKTFSKPMREKLDIYCDERDIDKAGGFVLSPRDYLPMRDWLDVRTLQWEDIKATKLPVTSSSYVASGGPSMVGHYPAYTPDGYDERVAADDLNDGRDLYYTVHHAHHRELLPDGATLVELKAARKGKFCRLFPAAVEFGEWLRTRGPEVWEEASDAEREAWQYTAPYNYDCLPAIDPNTVNDPALAAEVRLYRQYAAEEFGALAEWEAWLGHPRGETARHWDEESRESLKPYPLLEYGSAKPDELTFYVNAVYAANEERK